NCYTNPPCFAKQNANPLVSRGFASLFCEAKCEPFGEQRICLLFCGFPVPKAIVKDDLGWV
ncbi:hypothetical protein, partial [Eisenbergiella massiliensis]|uniref:hypothetical protein n=1 Tax=Eisenbergiella massiliensis TaxID=1720294 RepID=UPI001A9A4F93